MDLSPEARLLIQHAEVLFDSDEHGRLVAVNEQDGEPPPRLFVARGRETTMMWFRSDVPTGVTEQCLEVRSTLPRWDGVDTSAEWSAPLRTILGARDAVTGEERGPAFRFPAPSAGENDVSEAIAIDLASADLLERFFPHTRSTFASRAPVAGVLRDGAVVSACYCARKRSFAAEAGVATVEAYRGLGLATAAVRVWRAAVESSGAMPLYSTTWENAGSLGLAAKLSLVAYADTLSLA